MHRGPPPTRTIGPLAPWMDRKLRRLGRSHHVGADVGLRARLIRALARDPCVSSVAARFGLARSVVRLWRNRFLKHGIKGLYDKPRSGRSRRFDDVARCELISMACARPSDVGIPFRTTWTLSSLCDAYRERHPEDPMSRSTVSKVLHDSKLRPHRMRLWLHSPDPEFRAKATEICDLYRSPPSAGTVLCIDEKTGMQALSRRFPIRWPTLGRAGRFEFEYRRHGTRSLIAALDVRTGKVYGEVRAHRTAADLVEFMEQVARLYPTGEVHVVWDNLNIHGEGKENRWTTFNERHGHRFHFHYTPIHASWVNQVEMFFARVQNRVLRHADFASVRALTTAILGFIDHWNRREARPFRWTFGGYPRNRDIRVAA